jgi:hypothetical protein
MNKVKPIEALARKRGANELAIDLTTLGASSTSSLLYTITRLCEVS